MAVCSFASQSYRYDKNFSGRYTGGPYKGILHTTEGGTLPSYGGGASAPHFTVVPDFRTKTVRVYQHFDTRRPARALLNKAGGVQTNNDSCVQIELVGTCDPRFAAKHPSIMFWPEAPKWALDGLAKLMRWVEAEHNVPRKTTSRPWLPYPSSYGSRNGQRMTNAEFDNFGGWMGHQHCAENDHGDPGNLDIAYLLEGPSKNTTVVKATSTVAALAAALGLSLAALLGANPALPATPSATVTPGVTITIPAPKVTPSAPKTSAPKVTVKAPATKKAAQPVTRIGARGEHVKTIQRAVGVRADGVFGAQTERAVRAYQRARGLSADGIVGAATWAKINGTKPAAAKAPAKTSAAAARPVLRKGSESRHVRTVQAKVGVRVDGQFGPATDRAVRAFQAKHGLTPDGVVGPATWARIL